MKIPQLIALSLFLAVLNLMCMANTSCESRTVAPSTPGPIQSVSTDSTTHISSTEESFVVGEANAVATGNKPAVKANQTAIPLQENSQFNGSAVELSLAGIVVVAGGAAAWVEFGATIGGGILVLGGALIVTAFVADALFQYRKAIAFILVLVGALYEAYRHSANMKKLLVSTEALLHTIEQGVKADVTKLSTEAYTLFHKLTSLFVKAKTDASTVETAATKAVQTVVPEVVKGYRSGGPNG